MDQFHMADLANYAANVPMKSKMKLQGAQDNGKDQDLAVECPKFNDLLFEKKEQPELTQEQEQMAANLLAGMQIFPNVEMPSEQVVEQIQEESLLGMEAFANGAVNVQVAKEVQSKIQYSQKDVVSKTNLEKALPEDSKQMVELEVLPKEENPSKKVSIPSEALVQREGSKQSSKEEVHESKVVEQKELPTMQPIDRAYDQVEKVSLPQQPKVQQTEVKKPIVQETMKVNTKEEIPQQLAKRIVEQSTKAVREFEIQIEPKNLGKMAVKLEYRNGEALISIVCTEPKTLELVKNHVNDIRMVVQRNLQEDMTVFVDEKKAETFAQQEQGNSDAGRESEWERQKEKRKREAQVGSHRFLQELRLGLHV